MDRKPTQSAEPSATRQHFGNNRSEFGRFLPFSTTTIHNPKMPSDLHKRHLSSSSVSSSGRSPEAGAQVTRSELPLLPATGDSEEEESPTFSRLPTPDIALG